MKKMLTVFLSFMLTVSLSMPAYAQAAIPKGEAEKGTVILNAGNGAFGSEAGSTTSSLVLEEERTLPSTTPAPTRQGWEFEGWYTAAITENFWGDTQGETLKALEEKYGLSREEARNKDFTWIIESGEKLVEEKGLLHNGDVVPEEVETLYAVYKPTTVTVTWHYNDAWVASDGETQTGILTHNNKQYGGGLVRAEASKAFAWEGHTLLGWYKKDGTEWKFDTLIKDEVNGDYYISSEPVTEDLDLYAKWSTVEPETIRLTSQQGTSLVEPGTEVTISATYAPSHADAPKLTWEITDGADLAELQDANNGLTCTLSIKKDANVTERNKIVTVKATSTSSDLSAEISITVGHTWGSGQWIKQSSCTEEGQYQYKCKNCAATKIVKYAASGHLYVANVTQEPTCVEEGVKTYTCIVGDAAYTEKIPATGVHTWDKGKVTAEPTCVNTGTKTYTCTGCKTETKEEVIPATGHVWEEIVNLNLGKRNHYNSCTVCGKTEFLYAEDVEPTVSTPVPEEEKQETSSTDTGEAKQESGSEDSDKSKQESASTDSGKTEQKESVTDTDAETPVSKKLDNKINASDVTKTYSAKVQSFSIGAKETGDAKLTYSSNNKSVTVSGSGKVTVKEKFVGKATITIRAAATDKYKAASKVVTIKVNPSGTKLSKVKNGKGKALQLTWKKNADITGYQFQYSTDKNFKTGVKKVTVTKKSTVSKKIKSLKEGKTYYVRIRTYKTVSGSKYYSDWSSVKKVKVTK